MNYLVGAIDFVDRLGHHDCDDHPGDGCGADDAPPQPWQCFWPPGLAVVVVAVSGSCFGYTGSLTSCGEAIGTDGANSGCLLRCAIPGRPY